MSLNDKNVLVTGGSRGLGLGLVEALVAHGASVTVVARGAEAIDSVRARLGVTTISGDVTDETAAHRGEGELPLAARRMGRHDDAALAADPHCAGRVGGVRAAFDRGAHQ